MSEINGPQFSVNQINFKSSAKAPEETPVETAGTETKQLNEIVDNQAALVGRSMVNFKGIDEINNAVIDNTDNDLKALIDNPQIAENSDEIFEQTFNITKDNGAENPYEEAASIATTSI